MIELLQTLSILVVAGYIVIIFQCVLLYSVLRSRAWFLLIAAWIIGGALRFWGFIRLPHAIQLAQARGIRLEEVFTYEAWIQIAMGYAVIVCTIIGLHVLRANLSVRLKS